MRVNISSFVHQHSDLASTKNDFGARRRHLHNIHFEITRVSQVLKSLKLIGLTPNLNRNLHKVTKLFGKHKQRKRLSDSGADDTNATHANTIVRLLVANYSLCGRVLLS